MKLDITKIRTDGGTQVREKLDQGTVELYAERIATGDTLPPLVVFFDGVDYWLASGFHRYEAYLLNEVATIEVEVKDGTREEALWFAVGANRKHGLPLSRKDKRRAIAIVLGREQSRAWSNGRIASYVGCTDKTVASVRNKLESTPEFPELKERVGSDGKTRKIKEKDLDTEPADAVKAGPSDEPLDSADDFQLDLNLDSMDSVEVAAPREAVDESDKLADSGPMSEPVMRIRVGNLKFSQSELVERWPDGVEIDELTRAIQDVLVKLLNRFPDPVNRGHVKKVVNEINNAMLCFSNTE